MSGGRLKIFAVSHRSATLPSSVSKIRKTSQQSPERRAKNFRQALNSNAPSLAEGKHISQS